MVYNFVLIYCLSQFIKSMSPDNMPYFDKLASIIYTDVILILLWNIMQLCVIYTLYYHLMLRKRYSE